MIAINEVFGPTIQGEGPTAGQPSIFLRTAGCNLSCGWCDTPYSWDWKRYSKSKEVHKRDIEDVVQAITSKGKGPLLVITGGEPMLQQKPLLEIIRRLREWNPALRVQVETNGTILPLDTYKILYVVSPKLSGSNQPPVPVETMRVWGRIGAHFKWVVSKREEITEIQESIMDAHIPLSKVWVMPEGTDTRQLDLRLSWLAEEAAHRGWNVSDRLQVRAWGQERGR